MNPDVPSKKTLQLLYVINKLITKTLDADSREALKFIILNDTIHLVRYDRALLWSFEGDKPEFLGVSGQGNFDLQSSLVKKWQTLMEAIPDKEKPLILFGDNFIKEKKIWDELEERSNTTILWLPISADENLKLGLWLELWHYKPEPPPPQNEAMQLLYEYLAPAYGIAWTRLKPGFSLLKAFQRNLHPIALITLSFFISTLIVRIPLRVVAPAEVVPQKPFLVTAPLEGIVEEITVKPGETVKIGDPLFRYDKRVIELNLDVSKKKVEIATAEWNRAINLGHKDPESLTQVTILKLKMDKEKLAKELAEYEFEKSTVKAEINGVVILDDPDSWRGNPVKVGEKVMFVTDPLLTKLRIWIPESDNVTINREIPIKVMLNTRPEDTEQATLTYVGNASTLDDKGVASFIAEAEWVEPPKEVKLGVRGTAILYGENVSLFYYLFRKPWALTRHFLGI